MLLGDDILPLTPSWKRGNAVMLVHSLRALDLCRQHACETLAVRETLRHFDNALGGPALRSPSVRAFLSDVRLTGVALPHTDDSHLLRALRHAIERGDVVGLRQGGVSQQARNEPVEQRRLVAKIEQVGRTTFSHAGRQYKLIVDVDLAAKTPGRDSYEVVGHEEAKRVLDGVAHESGAVAELTALLGQASEKLARDWRPPLHPDGLVLLRRIRQAIAPGTDTGPAMTPSQMKQQLEQAENVHPLIEGTPVDLDLADVDLPPAADESAEAASAGDSESSTVSEESEQSDDSPAEG